MNTCKACGHITGTEFYTVTLTQNTCERQKDGSYTKQFEQVGILCGDCWFSLVYCKRGAS